MQMEDLKVREELNQTLVRRKEAQVRVMWPIRQVRRKKEAQQKLADLIKTEALMKKYYYYSNMWNKNASSYCNGSHVK